MKRLLSRASSILGMTLALAFVCGGVAEAQDNPCPDNGTADIARKLGLDPTEPYISPVSHHDRTEQRAIEDQWKKPRKYRGDTPHTGVDIYVPEGSRVVAITDGKFVSLRRHIPGEPGGNIVFVQDSKGNLWAYMHLQDFNPDLRKLNGGDTVSAGTPLGWSGKTGIRNSDPHLHVDIRKRVEKGSPPADEFRTVIPRPKKTYDEEFVNPYLLLKHLDELPQGDKLDSADCTSGSPLPNSGPERPSITAKSYGDPHIVTYDRLRYSFQTVGEFVLTRAAYGEFEIQTRQMQVTSSLSLNTAVAMNVDGTRVAIYLRDVPDGDLSTPLRVDGQPVPMRNSTQALANGGQIEIGGDNVVVSWPTGERCAVRIYSRGQPDLRFLDVFVQVPGEAGGLYEGLLGDGDGDDSNDLKLASGAVLNPASSYGALERWANGHARVSRVLAVANETYLKKLSRDLADTWRVDDAQSLFDYVDGRSTRSYTDPNFPESYHSLADLPIKQIQSAQQVCQDEGVRGDELEACVFDVAFSGYSGFARSASQAVQLLSLLEDLGLVGPITASLPRTLLEPTNLFEEAKREVQQEIKKKILGGIFR